MFLYPRDLGSGLGECAWNAIWACMLQGPVCAELRKLLVCPANLHLQCLSLKVCLYMCKNSPAYAQTSTRMVAMDLSGSATTSSATSVASTASCLPGNTQNTFLKEIQHTFLEIHTTQVKQGQPNVKLYKSVRQE